MRKLLIAALLLSGMALGGCGEKIVVYQYPEFWDENLGVKSIAVWPFRNQSSHEGAGEIAADKLASVLTSNGTYTVFNASDLGAVQGANDLRLLAGDVDAATKAGKEFGKADAVLTGTVTTFDVTTQQETRYNSIPVYGNDGRGNLIVTGYNNVPYQFTRHDAIVECTVSLVRLRDNRVIHSINAVGKAYSEGQTPEWDPNSCKVEACSSMVGYLLDHLAIVRKEIELKSDSLLTATGLYDNKWDKTKSFASNAEKMLLVLKLPPQCDRNRFRLVIVRKDQREELACQDVVWDDAFPDVGQGFAFNPSELAAKGGGPGKYTAKFYSGPEPVLTKDFTIK